MARAADPGIAARGTAAVWGDGFAGDDFAAIRAASGWDGCSTDEYAVLFPRLVPSDGRLPGPLLTHLAAGVAARTARLARLGPATTAAASGVGRAWSAAPDCGGEPAGTVAALFRALLRALLRAFGPVHDPCERAAGERRLLVLLDGLLGEIRRGSTPAWSEDREAWFAFGSGIHPGYLWPEGAISPDRGLAAAWLGHLHRGRTALMPASVADYLVDAVLNPSGRHDRALAAMVGGPENARKLRRAAAARLAGADPAVRLGRGWRGAPAHPRPHLQPAAVGGDVLEHA